MLIKEGMLVKAKANLTITKESIKEKDFLPAGNTCLVVNIVEERNKTVFYVLCEAFKSKYGLEVIVIPYKKDKKNSTVMKYFSII